MKGKVLQKQYVLSHDFTGEKAHTDSYSEYRVVQEKEFYSCFNLKINHAPRPLHTDVVS